jgi:hypothetical protein
VPIAIAGSKLCAETIFDDLSIPYPSTYKRIPSNKTPYSSSSLDKRQSLTPYYTFEVYLSLITPYLVGALLALSIAYASAYFTGAFDRKSIVLPSQAGYIGLSNSTIKANGGGVVDTIGGLGLGLDGNGPAVIGATVTLLFLSVLYSRSR